MVDKKSHDYWSDYYKNKKAPTSCSPFAKYITESYLKPSRRIVELGCGNGRDAIFFASNDHEVVAIDQCNENSLIFKPKKNLSFKSADFTNLEKETESFDVVYSRFTLHSVDEAGETRSINWAYDALRSGGKLFIETRGQLNELFGLGEVVIEEENAYIYEGHYRRFSSFNSIVGKIKEAGFVIEHSSEKTGYAPYGETDYHFIRIIAVKP